MRAEASESEGWSTVSGIAAFSGLSSYEATGSSTKVPELLYVLEQRWQSRLLSSRSCNSASSQSSRLSRVTLVTCPGRDGSSRQIKLLTRVWVLNKGMATCPIRKVARVKD